MVGGISTGPRLRYARRWAALSFSGFLAAATGGSLVCAEETVPLESAFAIAADRLPRPGERSILIQSVAKATVDPEFALVTDQTSPPLEPIADAAEYEEAPDLAEGVPPGESPEPTLAEELATDDAYADVDALPTDESVVASDAKGAGGSQEVLLQTASFNGATPGVTTRVQLLAAWGDPVDQDFTAETLAFELKGFPRASVDFDGNRVAAIRVELAEPMAAEELIAKLGLTAFRPASMADEMGSLVSTSFPERGVTLHHLPNLGEMASDDRAIEPTPVDAVCEIVVAPVGAEGFIDRAHSSPEKEYANQIADLETALRLDSKSIDCRHWLSEVKLTVGQLQSAEALAAEAVTSSPTNDEYRLQWAKCLTRLARYDEAVEQTRKVLEGKTAPEIVRAAALEQMARLAALGSKETQERAIPLHNKAIELADKLAAEDDLMMQASAHKILLDAHLGVADRISTGDWQQKEEFVGQWITRASGIAEQMINAGEADLSVRLQVAQCALLAGGRLSPPIDPQPWIAEAEQAAAELAPTLVDALAREELDWQLGLSYLHAAEVQHRRGESKLAVKYGEQAQAKMAPLAASRSQYPDADYALGRVYFQLGAVHAVHFQDHETACQWYKRAEKLLLKPAPMTTLATPGQHGDSLVSMGVSYWEAGDREKAYQLTKSGLDLINQGVNEGILATDALLVGQGNLNAMAQAMGKIELATPEPRVGRTQVATERRSSTQSSVARATNSRGEPQVARRATAEGGTRRR